MSKNAIRWTKAQYDEFIQRGGSSCCPPKSEKTSIATTAHATQTPKRLRQAKQPNKTEAAFGRLLEIRLRKDEFARIDYEGITLRWLEMRYTPDWVATTPENTLICFEVKGPKIWDRDIVRFKGAKAFWPQILFEMWQHTKNGWQRLA